MRNDRATYRLRHTLQSRLMTIGLPVIMGAFGVVIIAIVVAGQETEPADSLFIPFMVLWFGVVGFHIFRMLRIPTVIEWDGGSTISFRSMVGTTRIAVSEIERIRPAGNLGFFELRYGGKKLLFVHQFDGFHEFLTHLKEAKPSVEILGC